MNYVSGKIVDLPVGNTERAAQMLRLFTGGDLFHIRTASVYPNDYQEVVKIAKKEKNDRLYKAILTLETEEECYNFFQDLCTIPELRSMEQRYEVATLLNNGLIYNDILERTGASSATISRVNRSLIYGAGGYESVLEKMKELEEKEKAEKEPKE